MSNPPKPKPPQYYRDRAAECDDLAAKTAFAEVMRYAAASWRALGDEDEVRQQAAHTRSPETHPFMATAAELRADASRMHEFARTVADPDVLAELDLMIEEFERRARGMDNGRATD